MDTMTIAAIIIGVVLIGGIALVGVIDTVDATDDGQTQPTCGNSCTAGKDHRIYY